jgi:ankyrin repeat protein
MKRKSVCASWLILFRFFSQCTPLHLSAFQGHLEICRLLLQCNADIEAKDDMYLPLLHYYYCFHEAKLCLRKLILLLFFSQCTPLHWSARYGLLEITRLLVESKADVAARKRCFSPPPSHHLSLTICLAAMATLHSNAPSTTTKTTLLHTCAASARLNDALPRVLRASIPVNNAYLFCAAAAVGQV